MKKFSVIISFLLAAVIFNSGSDLINAQKKKSTVSERKASSSKFNGKSGQVDIDDSFWIPNETNDVNGISENMNCYSDNYYVINNRKIALLYSISCWHNSPTSKTRYYCGFNFIDVTDKNSMLPLFKTSGTANKKLTIVWGNGIRSSSETIDNRSSTGLLIYSPDCITFQNNFNRYKTFRVNVITADGKDLSYDFNLIRRGPLTIN